MLYNSVNSYIYCYITKYISYITVIYCHITAYITYKTYIIRRLITVIWQQISAVIWLLSHVWCLILCFIYVFLRGHLNSHPWRPRGSQSGWLKRYDERFQTWAEEPLGTDSHQTISKRSRECWFLIEHKKCFVLWCPIGEESLQSSFREFVHDGYYPATVAQFVHQTFLTHPRRPRGGQSGRGKRHDKGFQAQAEKPLGTDSHRTISKRSSECWLLIGHKKCFVLLCPIGEQHLLSSFREFVHDGYWLDHGLSGSCTKEMHAVRNLSVWYKRYISKYW